VEDRPERIGPYQVRRQIGAGGMGIVYEAHDPRLGRSVALKTLRPELYADRDARRRFLAEARAMAGVSHPNVVQIYDIREERGAIYFAMELLDGTPLDTLVRERGPLSLDRALDIVDQTAAGLQAAAGHGIIHRDVKPANLLLDAAGRVKVTDFGLAKKVVAGAEVTSSTVFFGTPCYLSPERASGQAVDERSDIYSLGATLYELLTGKPPFSGANPVAVISKHLTEPVPPPRHARPDLPYPVQLLVLQMLAKEPQSRPQNYAVLRSQLARLRDTEWAPPAPDADPSAPTAARGRSGSWAGLLVGGVLVVAVIAIAWNALRPNPTAPPDRTRQATAPAPATAPTVVPPAAGAVPEPVRKADLVVVRNVSEVDEQGRMRILGEVKNVGDGSALQSRVRVALVNEHGEEFGAVEVPLNPAELRPQATASFEATLPVETRDAVVKLELSWVS